MTVIDRHTVFENLQGLTDESRLARCADALYDDESVVRATNPIGDFRGVSDIAEGLWLPLIRAMRGLERRPLVFVAQDGPQGDTGLDAQKVATLGHLVGEFVGPWCGIEPTGSTVFLRFAEILQHRLGEIHGAFATAMKGSGYRGEYCCVYPIKVNQQRQVVEEVRRPPREWRVEAGVLRDQRSPQ